MELSIIIPVYNGTATIGRCLDSIYSQGLNEAEFEVICVDDCSPDPSSVKAVEEYRYKSAPPSNLKLIRHTVNKRQGGARNTGIRAAKGTWIMSVDCDDYLIEGKLSLLIAEARKHTDLDFIMYDMTRGTVNHIIEENHYQYLAQDIMNGRSFIQRQEISWFLWQYMYKRENIEKYNLRFEENVRFEDADFILKYLAKSNKGKYTPINLIYYVEHDEGSRSSNIGNDKSKITELLKIEWRIAIAANEEMQKDKETGIVMMRHALVHRQSMLKRYIWRLPFTDMMTLLREYQYPFMTGNRFYDSTIQHPATTALTLTLLKPAFHTAATIKKMIRKR